MKKRPYAALTLLFVVVALSLGCKSDKASTGKDPRPKPSPKCNVLLITFDALRADHMGIYGYGRNTSPNLDAFGREAFVFTDAMSQAGTTVVSFPSMFTSKFPWTDGLYQKEGRLKLNDNEITLAQILSAAGYDTAAVVTQRFTASQFGYSRGFKLYDEDYIIPEPAERTLERMFKALPKLNKPFFMWVHFMPPHMPYQADPKVFKEFYPHGDDELTVLNTSIHGLVEHYSKQEPLVDCYFEAIKKLTTTVKKQIIAHYDGHIHMADKAFGRLMARLKKKKLLDDTIVIVGADHGENLGEHAYIGHNRLSWPSLHVPLMVRLPKLKGTVLDHPVMNLDIFPTVLNLLGLQYNRDIRGRDLFDNIRQNYFQLAEYDHGKAIKKDGYMLVERNRDTYLDSGMVYHKALFNLKDDPFETKNLIDSEPERADELRAIAKSLGSRKETPKTSDQMLEQLKKLGYIK